MQYVGVPGNHMMPMPGALSANSHYQMGHNCGIGGGNQMKNNYPMRSGTSGDGTDLSSQIHNQRGENSENQEKNISTQAQGGQGARGPMTGEERMKMIMGGKTSHADQFF